MGRLMGFLSDSVVKNPPAMQETQVPSLGGEDALKQEMATHSSILAWEIPWTDEPGRLQSVGSHRVGHAHIHEAPWAILNTQMISQFTVVFA